MEFRVGYLSPSQNLGPGEDRLTRGVKERFGVDAQQEGEDQGHDHRGRYGRFNDHLAFSIVLE